MKVNYKKFFYVAIMVVFHFFHLSSFANEYLKIMKNNEDINNKYNLQLAKVKKVIDGDTVHLYTGGEKIRTRLKNIDCLETSYTHRAYKQAYYSNLKIDEIINQGNLAKNELKNIIKKNNNYVYFKALGVDKYGRLLAILYDENFNSINEMMENTDFCTTYIYRKNKFYSSTKD